ncbi:MAG TPA: creatininase family protein [Vicinamibacteria bacterium]|nr:creatininase family protein [Vicinamibacteria bacterium]
MLAAVLVALAAPGAYLAELTWPEAEKRLEEAPLVVLPFAPAAKEHGPHLPLNADAKVAEYLCARAVEALPVVVAPPVHHGWLPAFRPFPGTEVADPTIFIKYVDAVARSLIRSGARRIVFLNTSISKAGGLPLSIVARDLRVDAGVPTLVVSWDDLESDALRALESQERGGHGDEIETSIHLYLQPGLVHMEKAVTDYGRPPKAYPGYEPGLYSRDPKDPAYSESGLTGDPKRATAEKGQRALELLAEQWLRALRGFSEAPLRMP